MRRLIANVRAWVADVVNLNGPRCWCGAVHRRGFWHDPTDGQIDRDIQDYVARAFPHLDRRRPSGRAQVAAIESTLQERRRRGTLTW